MACRYQYSRYANNPTMLRSTAPISTMMIIRVTLRRWAILRSWLRTSSASRHLRHATPDASPWRADEDCYLCPRTKVLPIFPTTQPSEHNTSRHLELMIISALTHIMSPNSADAPSPSNLRVQNRHVDLPSCPPRTHAPSGCRARLSWHEVRSLRQLRLHRVN